MKANIAKATAAKAKGMKAKTKPVQAMKTPAAKVNASQSKLIRIEPEGPFVYCEILHTAPIKSNVFCEDILPYRRPLAAREVKCDDMAPPRREDDDDDYPTRGPSVD